MRRQDRSPNGLKTGIWILGPNTTGYPGGFPNGLINRVRKLWWGARRLWLCSGSVQDGVTIDLKREVDPMVQGDATRLPFQDRSFDFVMADPPYSKIEAEKMYGTSYPSPYKLIEEGWRVLDYGGHLLFLHRLIPGDRQLPFRPRTVALIGVGITGAWSNIRALTVFRKPHPLSEWNEDS